MVITNDYKTATEWDSIRSVEDQYGRAIKNDGNVTFEGKCYLTTADQRHLQELHLQILHE
jgi:hypothetical protein